MQGDEKVATQCSHCGKQFVVPADLLGRRVRCANCREPFEVVEVEQDQAPTARVARSADRPAAANRVAPRAEAVQMAPPLPQYSMPAARPVWLEPKWIGVGIGGVVVLILGLLFLGGAFSSKPETRLAQGEVEPDQSRRPRAEPSSADAGKSAQAKAAALVPALSWATDGNGRAVGTATTAIRSAGTQVRIMLPPGTHAGASLPCVFICPAGSNLLTGVPWGDDEQNDFYGLLERGVAVCFYSLDGTVADYTTEGDLTMAMKMQLYLASGGGLANLQDAIDTVLARAPAVDPKRLGAMGHSSAGTVALAGAGADARIIAVAAMAPALDLPKRLAQVIDQLPGNATQQIYKMSPSMIQTLSADVLIIQADDDTNTPAADAQAFAAKHSTKVKLQRLASGGHGGAYLQGIGPGMDFLAGKLGAKPIAGAGKVTAGNVTPPATATAPEKVVVTPAIQPPAPPTLDPEKKERVINEAFWYKPRTNGVSFAGAGSIILAADWPTGYGAGKDQRGATLAVSRQVPGRKTVGIRVLVEPDANSPRLVTGAGLLPATDGKVGIDLTNGRIVMPTSEPRVLPAMGGGKIALFDCGDDTEMGLPTREAVIALEYEGKVVLIHIAVPKAQADELDKLIASVRVWALRGKKESVATPYVSVKPAK